MFTRLWTTVFSPESRLEPNFPWSIAKSAKTYGIALLYYFIGTLIPGLLIFAGLTIAILNKPDLVVWLNDPKASVTFMVTATIVMFVSGFSAELWYVGRVLKKDGLSLRKLLGFNLDTLGGNAWSAIWRGLVTYGILMAVDPLISLIPMPAAHDPAAAFLNSLTGWAFAAVAVLVIAGPIFEELIFRGFLYNSVRSSMWKRGRLLANIVALVVSSAAFALMHFNISGLVAYFVAGAILAESYRRSGSLYVPIVAHCLNNATAVVLLLMSTH